MNTTLTAASSLNTAVAGVLGRMAGGIGLTFLAAAIINALGLVPILFQGILGYVIMFAPLAMSLYLGFRADSLSASAARLWFMAFSAVMGVSLSVIFAVYTSASIASALLSTTVSFGALAAWGYFTRRDLSGWGPFLFAGVIGLIIASVIGLFIESTAFQMTINVLCILIFLGLTAYDMNRIRQVLWYGGDDIERLQWFSALSLYINFINIFVSMLQLFGNRE
jgi:FtsH-binding integral membrane protein